MKRFLPHLPFALMFLLALTWLLPGVEGLQSSMTDKSQHMEYVWLIPVLSLFLLWQQRARILACAATPQPAPLTALPFLGVASLFLFFGLRGDQSRFLQIAAILLLMAIPTACYGRKMLKWVWFPILLLVFVIPVGFLDNFTVPLRRASVSVTAVLLNGLGISVRQLGTAILSTSPNAPFQLDVADPCSGIRSLVALFVGTAAYGAIALHTLSRRWALFLASIPIAFLGNIVRLLLTAFTCHFISQQAGMGLHDNALFIIAPLYTLAIFWLTDWLKRTEKPQPEEATPPTLAEPVAKWRYGFTLVLALALPIFKHYASQMPPLVFESDAFLTKQFVALPDATMEFPWFCQNRACLYSQNTQPDTPLPTACPQCQGEVYPVSRAELDILPSDTQSYKVTYTFSNYDVFTVALVIAGENRMSIHRPELCLPSQGFVLSERQPYFVADTLPMATFSLRREGQSRTSGFAYVFLNSKGATISNLQRVLSDSWERSAYNRIPRWAMLTITSPSYDFQTPEGQAALQHFMHLFYPTLFTEPETRTDCL